MNFQCVKNYSSASRRKSTNFFKVFTSLFFITLILLVSGLFPANAEDKSTFPERIFAPYVDVLAWPTFSIEDMYHQTGQKYYTLAFVLSGGNCQPSWGGVIAMEDDWYKDQIQFIRSVGGDVIISFGGANGTELALSCTNVEALQAAYQSVIDRYQLKWVDFDIEGFAVAHRASIDLRNKAIQRLQVANPDLKIAFCLPVLPQGLTADGLYVLENAKNNGVRVDLVNVMAMDFGDSPAPNPEGQMGQYAINAAENTRAQVLGLGIDAQIGVTPMIGQNDTVTERFYVEDAIELLNWAQDPARQSWFTLLSMWSSNRDNNNCPGAPAQAHCSGITQEDFEFTKTFFQFSGEGSGNFLPSVSIMSPINESIFDEGDDLIITANAHDNDGTISEVAFFLNGNLISTDTLFPYTANLTNMDTGIHELTVMATDNNSGTRTSTSVRIFVGFVCSLPQWSSTAIYLAGDEVSYNGNKWEAKWWTRNTIPGSTGLWGVWKDLDVCGPSVNTPPNVTITSPSTGAVFNDGDNITITASASDNDGTIAQVELSLNGAITDVDTNFPYSFTLTGLDAGIHNIFTVATDNDGGTCTSQNIQITVEGNNTCSAPQWNPSNIYTASDKVSHNGKKWQAKWWTRNNEPGTTGQWGVWLDLGICDEAYQ